MPLCCPKENQKGKKKHKINIKSEKLNKRKEKLSVFKAFYNTSLTFYLYFFGFIYKLEYNYRFK